MLKASGRKLVETSVWTCDRCGKELESLAAVNPDEEELPRPEPPGGWRVMRNPDLNVLSPIRDGASALSFCQRTCMSIWLANFVHAQFPGEDKKPRRLRAKVTQPEPGLLEEA